jgi:lipopolysaccharide/colanic/teichoic acid biosynthesis glycosyltransferase
VLATTILSGDGSFQQLVGHRPYAVVEADPWSDATSPTRGVHLTLGFAKPLRGITGWYPTLNYGSQDSAPTRAWIHLRLLAVKQMWVDVDLRLRTVEWLNPMPNDASASAEWFDPSTGLRGNVTTTAPAHAVP